MGETSVQDLLKRVMPVRDEGQLDKVLHAWPSIVVLPALARGAIPYDLIGGTLFVAVRSPHAKQRLEQMREDIRRRLREKCGVEVEEVKVNFGEPSRPRSNSARRPHRRAPITPDEETVKALREQCPEGLDPEIADALTHLRAFFMKRFPEN